MTLLPLIVLAMLSLLVSIIMLLSSPTWLMVWLSLELNAVSLVPLLLKKDSLASESTAKYFMVQALASSMLMFLVVMSDSGYDNLLMYLSIFFVLCVKLGLAPFHIWLPSIIEGLKSWLMIYIMLTFQKLGPLLAVCQITSKLKEEFIVFIVIYCLATGALGAYKQTSLRKIFAYSSITNSGWFLSISSFMSENALYGFFFYYCLLLGSVMLMASSLELINITDPLNKNANSKTFMLMVLSLFSLGGVPPFTGFYPKMFVIILLLWKGYYCLSALMLLATFILWGAYLQVLVPASSMFSSGAYSSQDMGYDWKILYSNVFPKLFLFVPLTTIIWF